MPSPCLTKLPAEVHLLIGEFLKPSEMQGLIVSSKKIRKSYSKSYFHDVAFRGTNVELIEKLTAFLNAVNTQATTREVVVPAIKYVIIETENDFPSPGPMVVPRLIASSLGVMTNVQGIKLVLWWFSYLQRQELLDRCVGLPVWASLRCINMDSDTDVELLAILASKTRPESFHGLHFWAQNDLEAAKQCSPFLRRLVVPFKLPASPDPDDLTRFISNRTCILTQFARLEWLVLTPTHVKPMLLDIIRQDPKVFLNVLVKELAKLPYLKRLGLTFPSPILMEHQPGVPGNGMDLPAVEHYVRQWNDQLFTGLPGLQQVAFIHGDIVLRAVKGADATIRFSIESDLDRHEFPFGTLY